MRARAAWRGLLQLALAPVLVLVFGNSAPAVEPGTATSGALADQAEHATAAAAFGIAQTNNVSARLGNLHHTHDGCDRFDIGANIRWQRAPAADEDTPVVAEELPLINALLPGRCGAGWSIWADGDVDFGVLRSGSAGDRSGVRTPGLTLGADLKLATGAIVGAAVGYGRNNWNGAVEGAESSARGENAMLYTTFEPWPMLDVDALIGVGELSFDSRRAQAPTAASASEDRGGSQMFASLGLRADLVESNFRIAPYARYDVVRSDLDSYDERAGAGAALVNGEASATEDVLVTGVYADVTFTMAAVTVSPGLRVEQRRVRSGLHRSFVAGDASALLPAPRQTADSYNDVAGALSVPVRFGRATSIAFEYAFTSSGEAARTDGVRALLQTPF